MNAARREPGPFERASADVALGFIRRVGNQVRAERGAEPFEIDEGDAGSKAGYRAHKRAIRGQATAANGADEPL